MATPGYNESSVVLPSMFGSPGAAMENALDRQQQDKRFQYQLRKDNEMDEWRKLNLIQDLTDLSKHQTGSDVANAIGNRQASGVLQKYTAAAKNMSPSELMANVQKEMQATLSGMDAMKNELAVSDEQLKLLKTQFPELDISSLARDHRAEILSRRIKGDESFMNPLEVGQSQFDVTNPDFLSRYITGNKNLSENIINPKGVEETSVFTGTPNAYTKFSAKVPFWKKPNFEQAALREGFLQGKDEPTLELKSTTIPADALPSSNGKPFEVIDKDVYDRFSQDGKLNLELIAATRHKFPDYDKFNSTEKEYAKRNVLHGQIKALDQSNFHPVENRRPARTTVNVSGGSKGDTQINDIYGRMRSKVKQLKDYGESRIRVSLLDSDGQKEALEVARNLTGDKELTQDDVNIELSDTDELNLYDNNRNLIGTLPKVGVNIKVQPGVKEKREVVAQGKQSPAPNQKTYSLNGKSYSQEQVESAAKKSGMSVEAYTKKAGLK